MKKEKSELEQAKISAIRIWNEINAREKEKKKRISDETTALLAAHSEEQDFLQSESKQKKYVASALAMISKKQDKIPSWKDPIATASSPLFMSRVKNPNTSNTDDKKSTRIEHETEHTNTSTNQPTDEWLRLPEVPYNALFDNLSSDDPKTRDLEIRLKMLKAPDPIETELPMNCSSSD